MGGASGQVKGVKVGDVFTYTELSESYPSAEASVFAAAVGFWASLNTSVMLKNMNSWKRSLNQLKVTFSGFYWINHFVEKEFWLRGMGLFPNTS